MALRDKLRNRAQPFLEEGEAVEQVFMFQTGPHPYWILLAYLPMLFMKYYVVAVTDRAVVVLKAGALSAASPKAVVSRLPRSTRLGPLSGLWATSPGLGAALGMRVLVNKRWHRDVEAADGTAPGGDGPPPPPPPPPPG